MKVLESDFGRLDDGRRVTQFELNNDAGLSVHCINYGARIRTIVAPDRHGQRIPIVLGFDRLEEYLHDKLYFGPLCGRYANRLAHGRFELDAREYHTPINDPQGPNTLHGGPQGFDKRLWTAQALPEEAGVRFSYTSGDMEEGFPGELEVTATYRLSAAGELRIEYEARCQSPTIVNFTNHIYFNLAGAGSGDVLGQIVAIDAQRYAPANEKMIPSGQLKSVKDTALDFTRAHAVGQRIHQLQDGYDHTYALDAPGHAALLIHEPSSRRVDILSDQPALQFYTAGQLDGSRSGIGGTYDRFGACVFEPMHFPDSPHHPAFPSTVLRPGQTFHRYAAYRFSLV